jgi:phage-related protein
MADSDFSVYAKVQADTTNFEKGMKKAQSSATSLSNTFNNLSKIIKTTFTAVGIGMSIKAITDFGKAAVQGASESNKQFALLSNTVKQTGAIAWTSAKQLEEASKSISEQTNYSVGEIQQMQTVLLGFTSITGENFQGASDAILDMATVMQMDLTAATQVVGKALDDPIKGLDSLSRQGFKFSEEEKERLRILAETGKKEEAQRIILDTLAVSYGNAARAGQDSFAKQRHALENFSDTLGGKLIPITQVFADNNTKIFKELEQVISNIDVTPLVNILLNLSEKTSDIFERIKETIKNAFENIKGFISSIDFTPILKILDTLGGAIVTVINKFKELKGTDVSFFAEIFNQISSIFDGEMINRIADIIDVIVSAIVSLWISIQDVCNQIKELIFNTAVNVWNTVKDLFAKSSTALASSGQNIASWGDLFYEILNNVYKIFQDLINGVSALLKGDWAVAWEYAKLAVLRVCNIILDNISTIANAFPGLMNTIIDAVNAVIKGINKVRQFLGQEPIKLMGEWKSIDLAKDTGLEKKIEDAEKRIAELTGKTADSGIENLTRLGVQFSGFTSGLIGDIQGLSEYEQTVTTQDIERYRQILDISETAYKKQSEWERKLLEQRLGDLKDYNKEYHEIQIKLIEDDRQKAIDADTNGENRAAINKYYDNQIVKENKRAEDAKRAYILATIKLVTDRMKSYADTVGKIYNGVANTVKNAFKGIMDFSKKTFSGFKNIFSKLISIDTDTMLDNLLVVEDNILTFFVEKLPEMPQFVASAFDSIVTLMNSLVSSVNWSTIGQLLNNIIDTLVTNVPSIINNITTVFSNMTTTIVSVIQTNAPNIVTAISGVITNAIETLLPLTGNVLTVLGDLLEDVGTYLSTNTTTLLTSFKTWINTALSNLNTWIASDGLKNIISAFTSIFGSLMQFLTTGINGIVNAIIAMLPDIAQGLVDSFGSALTAVISTAGDVARLMVALTDGILDFIGSDSFSDELAEGLANLLETLFTQIIPELIVMIPKLLGAILKITLRGIPALISGIITGFINGLINTDWIKLVQDTFTGFVDAVKNFFGIHSPSTLFEGFGIYIIEGLWNGLKEMGNWLNENVGGFFRNMWNTITSVFSNVGDWFKNTFESAGNGIKNAFNGLGKWFRDLWNNILNIMKAPINGIIDALNRIIDGFNSISVHIPDWVPFVGGKTFGININKIQKLAKGTNNARKGLTLVGEQGPELVDFRGGERVYNNRNTKSILTEGAKRDNIFNVTFNNMKDTSAYTMIQQLRQYNRELAINGVI